MHFSRSQLLALAWLLVLALVAALAPWLPLPYPPALPDLAHLAAPPTAATRHWLGTDPQGRDVLAGLVFGARPAIGLAGLAALLATALGAVAGGAAGFWGNYGLRRAWPWWLAALGGAWWALALPFAQSGLLLIIGSAAWLGVGRVRGWPLPTWPVPLDALVQGGNALLGTVPRLVLVLALAAGGRAVVDRLVGNFGAGSLARFGPAGAGTNAAGAGTAFCRGRHGRWLAGRPPVVAPRLAPRRSPPASHPAAHDGQPGWTGKHPRFFGHWPPARRSKLG